MYEFVDQHVGRLGNGSRFILWAMRAWANSARRGLCPSATIGGPFVNMGAAAAFTHFHAAMDRLHRAPGTPIRFAPLACRHIAEGEAVMLALWADLVVGDIDRGLAVLRHMLPAASADLMIESMAGATDHLRHARLAPIGLSGPVTVISNDTNGDE
jgi:hypothetical protein